MNIEFLSNILKLIGKKFFYACSFFLIFIEFNEKLEEFFTINQKYYALLWFFAIIAIFDVISAFIGFLKNWYEYLQLEKYSLNALDIIKLNHKNGIEILYFLFNLPVYGNENFKLLDLRQIELDLCRDKKIFEEIVNKFSQITFRNYDKIFYINIQNSQKILIFDYEFYNFLKKYFQKNQQKEFDIKSIIL